MIEYNLTYCNRKSVAIKIEKDGSVSVRAPHNIPKGGIDDIVNSRLQWIEGQQAKFKQIMTEKNAFSLDYGDEISLYGKNIKLTKRAGEYIELSTESLFLPEGMDNEEIRAAIAQTYKAVAKKLYKGWADYFACSMLVEPSAVKVSSATTHWGSCSGKNNINLTWLLLFGDESLVKYVIVHELAHIRHHDHTKAFWKVVEQFCPEYKECEEGLRVLQRKLLIEGWL